MLKIQYFLKQLINCMIACWVLFSQRSKRDSNSSKRRHCQQEVQQRTKPSLACKARLIASPRNSRLQRMLLCWHRGTPRKRELCGKTQRWAETKGAIPRGQAPIAREAARLLLQADHLANGSAQERAAADLAREQGAKVQCSQQHACWPQRPKPRCKAPTDKASVQHAAQRAQRCAGNSQKQSKRAHRRACAQGSQVCAAAPGINCAPRCTALPNNERTS